MWRATCAKVHILAHCRCTATAPWQRGQKQRICATKTFTVRSMQALDLRTRRMMDALKGQIAGSVRQMSLQHGTSSICSASLDRWLRVHDTKTRTLLGKVYMKSQLTACCWATHTPAAQPTPLAAGELPGPPSKRNRVEA